MSIAIADPFPRPYQIPEFGKPNGSSSRKNPNVSSGRD